MKGSKEVLNSCSVGKILSEAEEKRLKSLQMEILSDVDYVCKKMGIEYSLAFGTLLGAVRHHGYIPWDDDIDICLFYKDFNALIEGLNTFFKNKYFYTGFGLNEDPAACLKICLNGTTYEDFDIIGTNLKRGISIDAFPMFYVPNIKRKASNISKKLLFLIHCVSCVSEWKWKRVLFLKSKNKKIRCYYKFRRMIGFFLSIIPYKKWISMRQKIYKKEFNSNGNCSVLIGGTLSKTGDTLSISESSEFVDYVFENKQFKGFKCADKVLSIEYGDNYMELPPLEKREKHPLYNIDFGD